MLKEISWSEIAPRVHQVNPELAETIEAFGPADHHRLYLATYGYGDRVLDKGVFQLPGQQGKGTVSLAEFSETHPYRENLSYTFIPMGLILSKCIEVFFEASDRVMPSKCLQKGTFFGLWELFDRHHEVSKNIWSLSAGVRTCFMLPKISDAVSHERLRHHYNIREYTPHHLLEQHAVFTELGQVLSPQWSCEVLFFGKHWAELDQEHVSALKLKNYWLQCAWNQSLNCRRQMDYDIAWEQFISEIIRRNWKVRFYIINTIKHLLAISQGIFPAFVPEKTDEYLPVSAITQAYLEAYMLKRYYPMVMRPKHLAPGESGYYSFYLPTLLEFAPKTKVSASIISDLKELKRLVDLFSRTTGITLSLKYFHTERDPLGEIQHSSNLPLEDFGFAVEGFEFSENSPFFRGCIQITRNR